MNAAAALRAHRGDGRQAVLWGKAEVLDCYACKTHAGAASVLGGVRTVTEIGQPVEGANVGL